MYAFFSNIFFSKTATSKFRTQFLAMGVLFSKECIPSGTPCVYGSYAAANHVAISAQTVNEMGRRPHPR